jgi:hypothetical protein
MKLCQILTRTLTEGIDYTNIPPEIAERLKPLKPHEQEWGIKEYHNGENINNILDSIAIYNNNIRDNRYSKILARHNPNYKNIFNYTSRIIHSALTEFEELRAPKPSNRKLQESRRNWSIEEPPYSEILVNNNRLRIIKVQRVDDTGKAAKIASDISNKTEWCTVNVEIADDYLGKDDLYFILLDGKKYLCHIQSNQLMDFRNRPFRISEGVYYLLSDYVPDVGLFMKDKHSEIYKNAMIKHPQAACDYARHVLKREWPEVEPIILKDPEAVFLYTISVLKRRWPEAEPIIVKNPTAASAYACYILKREWPEAEPTIIQDPRSAANYAEKALKRRWPEAEPVIMNQPIIAYSYARYVLGRRWQEAEPTIMKDPWTAKLYRAYFKLPEEL